MYKSVSIYSTFICFFTHSHTDSLDAFAMCMRATSFLLPNYALTAPAYQNQKNVYPLLTASFATSLLQCLQSLRALQSRKCQSKQNVRLQCEFPFHFIRNGFPFPASFPQCVCECVGNNRNN